MILFIFIIIFEIKRVKITANIIQRNDSGSIASGSNFDLSAFPIAAVQIKRIQ